jgi:hypothetical protein
VPTCDRVFGRTGFSGEGDIPQNKKWERGFFIGVGVDNQLLSSLRKLKKTGTRWWHQRGTGH